MRFCLGLTLITLFLVQTCLAQQVYKCTDSSGTTIYSDSPCNENPEIIDIPEPNSVPDFRANQLPEPPPYPTHPPAPGATYDLQGSSCWGTLEFSVTNSQDSFIRLARESDFDRALRMAKRLSYDLDDLATEAMMCDCILASGEFDQAAWDLRKASREEDSVEDFIRYLKRAANSFDSAVMSASDC